MLHDLLAVALAWTLAYLLRFNLEPPPNFMAEMWLTLIWVVPLQWLVFWGFGLYRGIWRYASINDFAAYIVCDFTGCGDHSHDVLDVALECCCATLCAVDLPVIVDADDGRQPPSLPLWKEQSLYSNIRLQGEPVLVLGVDDAAVNLSKEMARSNTWRVVGFLGAMKASVDYIEWHCDIGHAGRVAAMGCAPGYSAGHYRNAHCEPSTAKASYRLMQSGRR